jgi:hypothetical protein
MKEFIRIVTHTVSGAILGQIFLLPYLAWLYAPDHLITLDWTWRFWLAGIGWGAVCGLGIGLVPLMLRVKSLPRIAAGALVGGLAGIVFYLIGDLAFFMTATAYEVLTRSLGGLYYGLLAGAFCGLAIGWSNHFYRWFKRREGALNAGVLPPSHNRQRMQSTLTGLIAGAAFGNFFLLVVGQMGIVIFNEIFLQEVLVLYLFPLLLAYVAALFAFRTPIHTERLQRIGNDFRSGMVFGVFAVVYLCIFLVILVYSPLPRPIFTQDNEYVNFVLSVVVVFTAAFGLLEGLIGAAAIEMLSIFHVKIKKSYLALRGASASPEH